MKFSTLVIVTVMGFASRPIFAEESTTDKWKDDTKQASKDTKNSVKKAGRAASDEACPLVNGKIDCAGKKMKHKAQNAADSL